MKARATIPKQRERGEPVTKFNTKSILHLNTSSSPPVRKPFAHLSPANLPFSHYIMSHEQYAPPTSQPSYNTSGGGGGGSSGFGGSLVEQAGPTVQYLCGDCNSHVHLKKGDPIRCKECGHRVLYKERTKR
ncbi:DNA-directed RNA polymerase core subunit rpc10 [Schaereria dolodes]|nr:DNA-directed RNA polymerase core subunit rpc10 [Schaereria dolodes]